jgi:hypothetical protein
LRAETDSKLVALVRSASHPGGGTSIKPVRVFNL